ncbi:MAG: hypothetical protein LC799_10240, partial [Actinobacteria bacterium]|nr:hypothetical protein [Actinomycetota bacterium]
MSQPTGNGRAPAEVATRAAEALGPELGLLAGVDAAGFARAVHELGQALLASPAPALAATSRCVEALT